MESYGDNLIFNGSFEQDRLEGSHWASFEGGEGVSGWTGERIEVQKDHWGHQASNGTQWIELDAERGVDMVYQDVETEAGQLYELTFDVSTRFYDTSTFDVSWNGQVISTVVPQGREWETVTLTVEGTGGADRLAFAELASQNSALGAFIDNVQLRAAQVVEVEPISTQITLRTSEGSETIGSSITIDPTHDISINASNINLTETDGSVTVQLSQYLLVANSDQDLSEVIEMVSVTLENLPEGTTANFGDFGENGTFSFSGPPYEFQALELTLPADFSSENPATSIEGGVSARSNEGETTLSPFTLQVAAEADLAFNYTQAMDQTGDTPSIVLAHTDTQGENVELQLSQYFSAQVTDLDQSESLTVYTLSLSNLPMGARLSTDGGLTFQASEAVNGVLSFKGDASDLSSLVLSLPAISPETEELSITGSLRVETDEGGDETLDFAISNDRIIEDAAAIEDGSGVGVTVDVGFSASALHTSQIGSDWDQAEAVTIAFDRLPEGTFSNVGTLDLDGLTWTGTINEANDLSLTFPQDYSTSNLAGIGNDNLIVNGSFEDADLGSRSWGSFVDGVGVAGWEGGRIEIQDEGLGFNATDGRQWMELDAEREVDTIYQDIQTEAGQTYQLTFDVATRVWESSTFDVVWNGESIATVNPAWGQGWSTITLSVEGTGGVDRLAFTELASQNNAFGALIDNVGLFETGVVEDKPIELTTSINTTGDPLTFESSLVIEPTVDIAIETRDFNLQETDAEIIINPADHVAIVTTDSDGSEMLETISMVISNFPEEATASHGTVDADGNYQFTGIPAEFESLTLTFARDYATQSDQGPLIGEVSATSNEGVSTTSSFKVDIAVEGDLELNYSQAMDLSSGKATITLQETGQGSEGLNISLGDYFNAQVTDQDHSENIVTLTLLMNGLPEGTLLSTDGGTTFQNTGISNGTLDYWGAHNEISEVVLKLPADFSTTNPASELNGQLTVNTDEHGVATKVFTVAVKHDADIQLSANDITAYEDASGAGVVVDLNISASITDADGSEGSNQTADTVTITFENLPSSTGASHGSLNTQSGVWTGSVQEANALSLEFAEHYSTTSPPEGIAAGPISYDIKIVTPEGERSTSASMTINAQEDIELTYENITTTEDSYTELPFNLSVEVLDTDLSEIQQEPIQIHFTGLPDPAFFNGGTFEAEAGLWQGTVAEFEALALSGVPQHFSGKITAQITATSNEGSDTATFAIGVLPVAEPSITLSVTAQASEGDIRIVKEETPFTVHIAANTADMDGSEMLSFVVLSNTPQGWLTTTSDGSVDLNAFSSGAEFIQSANYDANSGDLTITLVEDLVEWSGDLTLTPSANESLDVESLMGGELTVTVTSVDRATGLPDSVETASSFVDVDVDAVIDKPLLKDQDRTLTEDLDSLGNSKIRITQLKLGDTDGSEKYGALTLTITADETGSQEFSISDSVTLYSSASSQKGSIVLLHSDAAQATYSVTQPENVSDAQFEGFVKNLRISYPQNFSGVFSVDGKLDVHETIAEGDNEYDLTDNSIEIAFDTTITVQPKAEALLTVTVSPAEDGFSTSPQADLTKSVSATVGQDAPTVEIYEDSSFTLQVQAATPDKDGSEDLFEILINNVPNEWFAYSDQGTVDPTLFGADADKVESATYDAQTGQLTLVMEQGVQEFEGALLLTPIAHDDRDVDAADSLKGQDSSGFFGDISVDLTVTDTRNMEASLQNTTTVSVSVDVNVEAVNDLSTLGDVFAVTEAAVDAAGGWLPIPLSPQNPDVEGSETIETVGIYGIPRGVVVFYENETGALTPAKLMGVDTTTGTTDWALENGQWSSAVLRGIPEHFSGVLTSDPVSGQPIRSDDGTTSITARVLTREFNDGETGQTDTGQLVIEVTPSIDGGQPDQTFNAFEDQAFRPNLDGNLIDISDDSPEELIGDVVLSLDEGATNSVGQEVRFFLGVDEPSAEEIFANEAGELRIDSSRIGELYILPPKDSNEDFSLGVEYSIRESTNPDGPTKTESGTLNINVKGVADTPEVTAPEEAYVGNDNSTFLLDSSVGGEAGAATRLGGMMTELMPDGINYDGSENLYFVITGDSLSTMAQQNGPTVAAPAVSFVNGVDTGAGAVIVSASDIGNLSFIPVNVEGTTDYEFTLRAIVVEDDEKVPTGTSVIEASALPGVAISEADFFVRVTDQNGHNGVGGGGYGSNPPVTPELPEPPDVAISPIVGSEDEEAMFNVILNNYGGDFSQIPQEGSIEITGVPQGSVIRAEPADAVSYNPISGSYFINHASANSETNYYIEFPENMSSADSPVDGLETMSVLSQSLNARFGLYESVEQVTSVYIDPVADGPTVQVHSSGGYEDTAIPIVISVGLVDQGETLGDGIELSLQANQGVLADSNGAPLVPSSVSNGQLYYEVSSDTTNLTLLPTLHLHGDIPITVTATSVEPNGDSASTTSTVTVPVEAVADVGIVTFDSHLETGVEDGEELPVAATLEDVSLLVDNVIATSTPDVDGSEVYSVTLAGLPDFLSVNVGTDNGLDESGLRSFTMTPEEYALLEISLTEANVHMDGVTLPEQVRLTVEVNTLELSNGDTNTGSADFLFKVLPDADAPNVSVTSTETGEDVAIALEISGELSDTSEVLSHFIIRDIPDGAQILVDGAAIATGPEEAHIEAAGINSVSFKPAPDSAETITLQIVSVSLEPTVEDPSAANATEESEPAALTITVTPQADVDLQVDVADVAQSGSVLEVDFGLSAIVTDSVGPETEHLEVITLSFNNLPEGATFNSGSLSADGQELSLSRGSYGSDQAFVSALAAIVALVPADFFGEISGTAQATTSEGKGSVVDFSTTINAQPHANADTVLDGQGYGNFTITETSLLENYSDPDSQNLSVINLQTNSSNASLAQGEDAGTWVLTVAEGFEGQVDLTYQVTDNENSPAQVDAVATVLADNELELQMSATDLQVDVADGESANLLSNVTGSEDTFDVAEGTSGNDAVIIDESSTYADVDAFSTLGGQDLVDLSFAYEGYTVNLGSGNDIAIGSSGADTLVGGLGRDILDGGLGGDTLIGGEGADNFLINNLDALDAIADYSAEQGDVIDLSALLEVNGDVSDFVQFNNNTGEISVDQDGTGSQQGYEVAVTLDMIPTNVIINVTDDSSDGNVIL
nr:cadherin-like domain-containing protein [Pseudovibrio sp. M1P-2-3]